MIAKPLDLHLPAGQARDVKIKHERTADCVVAGFRVHKTGRGRVGSLLLGLYDDDGQLQHVGVSARSRWRAARELVEELPAAGHRPRRAPVELGRREGGSAPRGRQPLEPGKDLSFVPLRPERVVEVGYDHMEGDRFRHPPSSCAGAPTATRRPAATSSSSSRRRSTSPTSWAAA